eukprot:Skav216471  [mRNA]  locus=scaffold1123:208415:213647:+ [translate_table: standard]
MGDRALQVAKELFEAGRVVEYDCYDYQSKPQGRGVLVLRQWEDFDQGLFAASHGPCSDGYYEWFINGEMGFENGLYHICGKAAKNCKVKTSRGDERTLIHLDRWRMHTPASMVEVDYLQKLGLEKGEEALAEAARSKKAAVGPGPTAPAAEPGGLDAALSAAKAAAAIPVDPRRVTGKEHGRSRSPRRGPGHMAEFLGQQAEKERQRQSEKELERGQKKKKKRRVDEGGRKSAFVTVSSSGDSSGSEDSSFRSTPARGGKELWRVAQKKPGHLTAKALEEMSRYLADRSETQTADQGWKGQKVLAYVNQVLFVANPPSRMGMRRGSPKGKKDEIGGGQRTIPGGGEVRESPAGQSPQEEKRRREGSQGPSSKGKGFVQPRREDFLQRREDPRASPRSRREEIRLEEPNVGEAASSSVTAHMGEEVSRPGLLAKEETGAAEETGGSTSRPVTGKLAKEGRDEGLSSRKVELLVNWMKQNSFEHLAAAQMGRHLILQAVSLNGTFGQLIENSLEPPLEEEDAARSLMPLPLWPDVRDAIQAVVDSQRYKDQPGEWRKRADTKAKANRQTRLEGYLLWHGLVVLALNWVHSGGNPSSGSAPRGGSASLAQEKALTRIWEDVKIFVEEKPEKGGVPRTPRVDWELEAKEDKVVSRKECLEIASYVTLEGILPGLPPENHGCLINLMEVVSSKLGQGPLLTEWSPGDLPKPKVLCEDHEWRELLTKSSLKLGAGLRRLVTPQNLEGFPAAPPNSAWNCFPRSDELLDEIGPALVADLEGEPQEKKECLLRLYSWWGFPLNWQEATDQVRAKITIQDVMASRKKRARVATKSTLETISLGSWLRGQGWLDSKAVRLYAGRITSAFQFRRCLLSVLQEVLKGCFVRTDYQPASVSLLDEMLVVEALLATAFTDVEVPVDPVVMASDADGQRWATCAAGRQQKLSKDEVMLALEKGPEGEDEPDSDFRDLAQHILSINLQGNIGGVEVALHRAGVIPILRVAVEEDPDKRRLLQRRFPEMMLCHGRAQITQANVQAWLTQKPETTGVIVAAPALCWGREGSSDRTAVEECAVLMKLIDHVAQQLGLWALCIAEGVASTELEVQDMSRALDMKPVLMDAADCSWLHRPQYYWLSAPLMDHPEVERHFGRVAEIVRYMGPTEPLEEVLEGDWAWAAGAQDAKLRLPTLDLYGPLVDCPNNAPGLDQASAEAVDRWRQDEYRHAPKSYEEAALLVNRLGAMRVLNANERELLAGYPKGHTLDLARSYPDTPQAEQFLEDFRRGSLGQGPHTVALACLFDHLLWSYGMKILKGHHVILTECHQELHTAAHFEPVWPEDAEASDTPQVLPFVSAEWGHAVWELERQPRVGPKLLTPNHLHLRLLPAFLKRLSLQGTDILVDASVLYAAAAIPIAELNPHRWSWQVCQLAPEQEATHLTLQELAALVKGVSWRLNRRVGPPTRVLHLSDAPKILGAVSTGHSPSRRINRCLQQLGALQVAGGVYLVTGWVSTPCNPATVVLRNEP